MSQAVRDDRMGDLRSDVAMRLEGADLAVELSTGATSDFVQIDLSPQPESKVVLGLNTGDEDDRIDVRSRSRIGPLDLSLAIDPGLPAVLPEVGDEVLVAFEHGDIEQPVVIGALWNGKSPPSPSQESGGMLTLVARAGIDAFAVDFGLIGTAGPDDVQLNFSGPIDQTAIDISTGDGPDVLDFNLGSTAELSTLRVNAATGAGADSVSVDVFYPTNPCKVADIGINLGTGNDTAIVNVLSEADETKLGLRVSGGGGADLIVAQVSYPQPCFFESDIGLNGGAGADVVLLSLALATVPDPNLPLPALDVAAAVSGGGGPDLVGAQVQVGPAEGALAVVTAGNDGLDVLMLLADVAGGPLQSQLLANGGAGFDVGFVTPGVAVANIEVVFVLSQSSLNQAGGAAVGPPKHDPMVSASHRHASAGARKVQALVERAVRGAALADVALDELVELLANLEVDEWVAAALGS